MMDKVIKTNGERPSVGVVIAGGGLKPIGASYLFDILEELEIPIDLLAATSGGTPVAACKAIGYTGHEIRDYFIKYIVTENLLELDYHFLMSLMGSLGSFNRFDSKRGVAKQDKIQQIYEGLFGDMKVEDLDIPLLIQATDLNTGESVIIDEGPLVLSICASGAIVPLLPPRKIGNRWLIEGAYSRETPLLELVKREIDFIIGISFFDGPKVEYHNFFEKYLDFLTRCFYKHSQTQRAVGVSTHHREIVLIPIYFEKPFSYWEGEAVKQCLEFCKKTVYNYHDEIAEIYQRVTEENLGAA